MSKWEYKSVVLNDCAAYRSGWQNTESYQLDNGEVVHGHDTWSHLNLLGAQGWELIAVVFETNAEALGILKRPLEDLSDE